MKCEEKQKKSSLKGKRLSKDGRNGLIMQNPGGGKGEAFLNKLGWTFKLITLFTLILGGLLLFQMLYVIPYVRNQEVKTAKTYQEKLVHNIARELDINLMRIKNRLIRMARQPEFGAMDIATQQTVMKQHTEISTLISAIFVMDPAGWLVSGTMDNFSELAAKNYAHRPYYAVSFEQGQVHFAQPQLSAKDKSIFTYVTVPIETEAGERVGILIGSMRLDAMIERVANHPFKEGMVAFVVDKKGTVVAHSRIDLFTLEEGPLSLNYSDRPMVQAIISGKTKESRKYTYDNRSYFGTCAVLESNGWGVVVETPMSVILAGSNALNALRKQLLSVNIVLFVVALFITLIFTRQITGRQKQEEQMLKATNQQLRATEQQLRAANQQLKAANQQLRATEQQLIAANQQLRASEQQIRKMERNWRESFNSLEDVMLLIDKDFNVEKINANGLKLLGKSEEDVVGKKYYEVIYGTNAPIEKCQLKKSLETGKVESIERFNKNLGRYFSIKCSPILDEEGKTVRFVELMRDITERKGMEKELKEKMRELERFNNLAIGREIRMVELKKEINRLLEELGQEKKYDIPGDAEAGRETHP